MKTRLFLFTVILFTITSITAISFAQKTRDNEKPITGDFKITFKQVMGGAQEMQATTMIKGARQRDETTMNIPGMPAAQNQVSITQCDMRRTIQINDSSRKYMITPMDSDTGAGATQTAAPASPGTSRSGGVVTMSVNTVDTGERREMFGFTARHMKRTTISQSSPDACNQQQQKWETDGWYINLEYGLNCGSDVSGARNLAASQTCRDRYQYKHTGPNNIGFPLIETTRMYGADGNVTFSMTKEVVDISRQPLNAALFDIPAGYTEARSQNEMYATPSMADMMASAQKESGETPSTAQSSPSSAPMSQSAATARAKVGVVEFNNKAKATVSTDELRQQLITTLNGNGVDAIALNASSAGEAEIEAKAKGCTYILYTDLATMKTASSGKKVGGFLSKATGVGSADAGKSEVKLDYRLVPVGSTSPKLQSSASAKEDNAAATMNAALQDEARAITGAVGNN